MSIIYPSPIFGPIHSRRLGLSLGVNLMPHDGKICTFDCLYCECGLNADFVPRTKRPSLKDVEMSLESKLLEMRNDGSLPDVITFAGNGEPTAHPDFPAIVKSTIRLRNLYCPEAKITVLSNATRIYKKEVFDALMLVDNNIQKLDTANSEYIFFLNRPTSSYRLDRVVNALKSFKGHCIIQTIFLKGTYDGKDLDNTGEELVSQWLKVIKEINPSSVMVYTIDRETPVKTLYKASREVLDHISNSVRSMGIPCITAY